MAKKSYKCECVEAFDHVIPASVLEIRRIANSAEPDACIDTPEMRIPYTVGKIVDFGTKRARTDFMRAHGGKFREVS